MVFDIIERRLTGVRVHSLIIEKRITATAPGEVLPKNAGLSASTCLRAPLPGYQEVLVFVDRIPVAKKRDAVEKTVRMTLADILPNHGSLSASLLQPHTERHL